MFITFEGGDGVGKSTHIGNLASVLEAHGLEVVRLREPGGTSVGESLRAVVLDPAHTEIADETELLIYEAARAQIVAEQIKPAIDRGAVVLCDRFMDSTIAYQGFGRGIDVAFIDQANAFACQGIVPDRTILMVTESVGEELVRATKDTGPDRLEAAGEDFHNRVKLGFLAQAERFPERIRIVDASGPKSQTAYDVFSAVADLFEWMPAMLEDKASFARFDTGRNG